MVAVSVLVRPERRGGPVAGRAVSPDHPAAADRPARPHRHARRRRRPTGSPGPEQRLVDAATATHLVGDPEAVHQGLVDLQARTGADELMLSTRAHSFEARAQSLTLVAEAGPRPATHRRPPSRPDRSPSGAARSERGAGGQHLLADEGEVLEVVEVEDLQVGRVTRRLRRRWPAWPRPRRACRTARSGAARPPGARWPRPDGPPRRRPVRSTRSGRPSSTMRGRITPRRLAGGTDPPELLRWSRRGAGRPG